MAGTELTLVVPALHAAEALGERREVLSGLDLEAAHRLLGRAETSPRRRPGADATLFELFDVPIEADGELPVAPLTLLHDSGEVPPGWWLRADPVALRPTQDRLIMEGGGALALSGEEARALCAGLNEHFADEGWRLQCPVPGRWYLPLAAAPQARFTPLAQVIGNDIHPSMPGGPQGRHWRARLNEAQMVLHANEVNQRRRAEGRTEINSLWFWGAGPAPGPRPGAARPPWTRVWSNAPLAGGLAMRAGIEQRPAPGEAGEWLAAAGEGDRDLIVLDRLCEPAQLGEVEQWRSELLALQARWFAPLHAALMEGRIAAVTVCAPDAATGPGARENRVSPPGGVDYHVTRKRLRHWWRRARPVAALSTRGPRAIRRQVPIINRK